jgi:hypothetical protein
MDQFTLWSSIVHSNLRMHLPTIKLGQVHQLLAACLGHNTYASLRAADLQNLNRKPKYVLFDRDAGLSRATELGLHLTVDHWTEVTKLLHPSGITPFWLTSRKGMHLAAQLTFEDTSDSRIYDLSRSIGFSDGRSANSIHCHSADDEIPDVLRFDVKGEIYAYGPEASFALPVRTVVEFLKIGRYMYDEGSLVVVEQLGAPRTRGQQELADYNDGDVFWMSED